MDALPFLVRASHIVGPVVALLLCGLGVVAVRRVVQREEARRAQALRGAMGSPVDELAEGDHVLVGVLEGTHERLLDGGSGVASTLRIQRSDRAAPEVRSSRAADLRLRIGDTSLRIDEPIEVLLGSQRGQRGGGRGSPLVGPRAVHDGLGAGDPVWVWAGVRSVPRDPDEGPTSYRRDARRWRLTAPSEPLPRQSTGTIALATAAAPRPPRRGRHVALGVALGFSVFAGLTGLAATRAGHASPGQVASFAEQLAVLSPVYRDGVGRRIVARLARGPASAARRGALDEAVALFDVCGLGPDALARHGLLDRAAEEADRCRSWYDAGRHAFAHGSLGEASAHWARAPRLRAMPFRRGVTAMALSGDPEGAARLTESDLDLGLGVLRGRDPIADQCLRDALRRLAHLEPESPALGAPNEPFPCRLIHATSVTSSPIALDELVTELVREGASTGETRTGRALALVWRWTEGIAPQTEAEVAALALALDARRLTPATAFVLVPHLLDGALEARSPAPDEAARRHERAARALVGVLRAKVAFALGDLAAARAHAASAWAQARDLPSREAVLREAEEQAATTHALLSLLAGEGGTLDEAVWRAAHDQARVARRLADGRPEGLDVDARLAATATGDGALALELLESGVDSPLLPFAAPRTTRQRAALRAFLAAGPSWPVLAPQEPLGAYLGRLALLGATLERLDEPDAAARVRAVGHRFAAAIERRPRAAELIAIASVDP